MRVAVLSGGRSSEHEVSLASGAAVRAGLAEAGHDVVDVHLTREGAWTVDGAPVQLTPGGGLLGADAAFPILHGPFGEDGTVQGLLELLDVPYVGAGVLGTALAMDKVLFKDVLTAAGIPQVPWATLRSRDEDLAPVHALGLPVFVKPSRAGSSKGIVKVTDAVDLPAALDVAFAEDRTVVVEAMAHGMEVEVAVMGNAAPEASRPGEIVLTGGADWYDYEAKYTDGGMELVVPARIPEAAEAEVRRLAVETFRRTDCAGLARVDFFVTEDGDVLVNELNTLPGFTPTSVYAKLWAASGLAFAEVCDRLVRLGVERFAAERAR